MTLNFQKMKIPDVVLIEPEYYDDERGSFGTITVLY